MPWGRPATDGPCGCGWGDTLVRGSRIRRLLGAAAGGGASGTCGCATAVVARATISCTPTPDTLFQPLASHSAAPHTIHLMVEAVEPAGPWRLFMDDAGSTTLFGPYTKAAPVANVLAGTVQTLRHIKMDVRVAGDIERILETFCACGAALPGRIAASMRGR